VVTRKVSFGPAVNFAIAYAVLLVQNSPAMDSSKRPLPANILQEYLEALAEPGDRPDQRQRKVLLSYAELQYRLHGGGRCSMCHSAVRHVLPVRVEHADGAIAEYGCLCTRCIEGEKAVATRITLTVGNTVLEYGRQHSDQASAPQKSKAGGAS
jgi:hypothetical protein